MLLGRYNHAIESGKLQMHLFHNHHNFKPSKEEVELFETMISKMTPEELAATTSVLNKLWNSGYEQCSSDAKWK